MLGMLLGGWNSGSRIENSNVNITVGVNWIKGGGPYADNLFTQIAPPFKTREEAMAFAEQRNNIDKAA